MVSFVRVYNLIADICPAAREDLQRETVLDNLCCRLAVGCFAERQLLQSLLCLFIYNSLRGSFLSGAASLRSEAPCSELPLRSLEAFFDSAQQNIQKRGAELIEPRVRSNCYYLRSVLGFPPGSLLLLQAMHEALLSCVSFCPLRCFAALRCCAWQNCRNAKLEPPAAAFLQFACCGNCTSLSLSK